VDDSAGEDFAARRVRVARTIQRRMVAHVAAGGTTDFAPGTMESDPAIYTDPVRAERERRELFLQRPLVAGLSQDIPAPGDSLLFEDLGQSIVIVRGRDGIARGFLNMCMHRGTKIVHAEANGKCERRDRLSCPFHAWTYDLDGRLAGVPGRAGFEGVDMTRRHLVPVPVAEWNGLVFVRPSAGNEVLDISAHLGTFAPELAQLELAEAAPVRASVLTAATNWKFAMDTYCEGYHFGVLHASTIGQTHYSNVAVFDAFGDHWRINFPDKGVAALVGLPETQWPQPDYDGIHFLFPNTIAVVGAVAPGRRFVRLFKLFPGDTPGTMTCRIAVYVSPGPDGNALPPGVKFADDAESDVTQEDYRVAVEGYANIARAPAGFKLVYGRNEIALQAFHRSVAGALGLRR
jgi:phenylpropionate dioxygenase-like ring-hydroxylating dioxygenase large terminal subunit